MTFNPPPVYSGPLPSLPPPSNGATIAFEVEGLPPYKDESFSIRNSRSKQHPQFLALREAAARAMNGRCWTKQAVSLDVTIYAPAAYREQHGMLRYVSGVMDSLDGSHGPTFTFLPIVYEDDCVVVSGNSRWCESNRCRYEVRVTFLEGTTAPTVAEVLSTFGFDEKFYPESSEAERSIGTTDMETK